MAFDQILIQVGIVIISGCVGFGFNLWLANIKDKKETETRVKAEKELEMKAKEATAQTPKSELQPISAVVHWEKVATLFWLGHEFMFLENMMGNVLPSKRLLQGVNNITRYLRELGFPENSPALKHMGDCYATITSMKGQKSNEPSSDYMKKFDYFYNEMQATRWYVDALVTDKQPGFEKLSIQFN